MNDGKPDQLEKVNLQLCSTKFITGLVGLEISLNMTLYGSCSARGIMQLVSHFIPLKTNKSSAEMSLKAV